MLLYATCSGPLHDWLADKPTPQRMLRLAVGRIEPLGFFWNKSPVIRSVRNGLSLRSVELLPANPALQDLPRSFLCSSYAGPIVGELAAAGHSNKREPPQTNATQLSCWRGIDRTNDLPAHLPQLKPLDPLETNRGIPQV